MLHQVLLVFVYLPGVNVLSRLCVPTYRALISYLTVLSISEENDVRPDYVVQDRHTR